MNNTQYNLEIAGVYPLKSSSPEGGSHLFIIENGAFAVAYFGGIQIGKWKGIKDDVIEFTPNNQESTFELFGRHDLDLKGRSKVCFNGFENGETFIEFGVSNEEKNKVQRVFNSDANCFSYPYVHIYESTAKSIALMALDYENEDTKASIITFDNPKGYNDFIINFNEVNPFEGEPFIAKFKDNTLLFNEEESIERTPLEDVKEDVEFIQKYIEASSNKDTLYLNPCYREFGQLDDEGETLPGINEYHVYDEQKNAYIDTETYSESVDYTNPDESYDDMSIIYAYLVMKDCSVKEVDYTINESPLFQVHCD